MDEHSIITVYGIPEVSEMINRRFLFLAALLLVAAALLVSCATAGHRGDIYVRFMSQGEEIAAFNLSKGEQIVVPEAPIREGYTFNGWWVTSEKGVLEYSEFKIPDDNASDIIVNARWLNTSFTMTRLDFNTDGAIQDGTIYKQHLLKFNGDGTCKVYSLLTNELVSTFTLDRSNVIKMHSNSVCLGPFLSRTDMLPLFYSNVYNSYSSELDKKKGTVGVYKLFYNGNAYSSMLIQLIRIGFTDDRNLWMSAVGSDRSPYGNFVVDPINNKIWFFVTRDANKTTRFFCFELPTPGAGEFDATSGVNVYTLTADDIIDMFDVPYSYYLQGACLHDGKIYSLEGMGKDENPTVLRVIDIEHGIEDCVVDIQKKGFSYESELIDYWKDGMFIYGDYKGSRVPKTSIYTISGI